MSLGAGSTIGSYSLLRDFEGGANCRWTFAKRDGKEYFIKEFQRPKYPPDIITGQLRQDKLKRCQTFEARHKRLVSAMGRVCAPGGNIVMPTDFFRLELAYYHIAPLIDTTSLSPEEIAALPEPERLVLLRLLSRSLLTLHSQRIVHGDLKPSNILIHRSGTGLLAPKLIDFDGSFFHGEPPDRDDMAFDQNYMAPEIVAYNKNSPEAGDARSIQLGTPADIFSIGILLHEYWTGRRPALGDGHRYAADAVRAGATVRLDVSSMDAGLASLVRGSLALNPADRPSIERIDQAIGEAASALRSGRAKPDPAPSIGVRVRFGSFGKAAPTSRPGLAEPAAPLPTPPAPRGKFPSVIIRKSPNLKRDDS